MQENRKKQAEKHEERKWIDEEENLQNKTGNNNLQPDIMALLSESFVEINKNQKLLLKWMKSIFTRGGAPPILHVVRGSIQPVREIL